MRSIPAAFRLGFFALLGATALPAAAAHVEIQGGRSFMDRHATQAFFVEGTTGDYRIGSSRFSWSPDLSVGWIGGRDLQRYTTARYSTQDDVWLAAAGIRLHYGDAGDWYHSLFFSFQPAAQTGRTLALSSGYEFVSTLGWQGRHFSVQVRHVSNGGTHGPNRGETMALMGLGFDL